MERKKTRTEMTKQNYMEKAGRKKMQPCKVGDGVLDSGQAEQYCTLRVQMISCLYSTTGDSLTSVEV